MPRAAARRPDTGGAISFSKAWSIAGTATTFRLIVDRNVVAVPAIDHALLKLIAPPVSGLRAAARGIFPFSFARQAVRLSGGFREPRDVLLCVVPAYVCNG